MCPIPGMAQPLKEAVLLQGPVVRGFGRGSKLLGIPTANIPLEGNEKSLDSLGTGIYAGWARLDDSGPVYPTVLSVGYNPQFQNTCKTIEPWLLHPFDHDFYDSHLRLVVVAFLRQESAFESLEALKAEIENDGVVGKAFLEEVEDEYALVRKEWLGTEDV